MLMFQMEELKNIYYSYSMNKQKAEKLYNNILKKMYKKVGKTTTYDSTLNKVGKKLFGKRFLGVFSSDRIPKLKKGDMLIANLDKSYESGSHWVGIVMDKKGITWVYDSFGRKLHTILPNIKKGRGKVKSTEFDAEQVKEQTDCGARSLCFLEVFYKKGIEYAKYI